MTILPITLDDQIACIAKTLGFMRRQHELAISRIEFPKDTSTARANADREELVLESILIKLTREKRKEQP